MITASIVLAGCSKASEPDSLEGILGTLAKAGIECYSATSGKTIQAFTDPVDGVSTQAIDCTAGFSVEYRDDAEKGFSEAACANTTRSDSDKAQFSSIAIVTGPKYVMYPATESWGTTSPKALVEVLPGASLITVWEIIQKYCPTASG